MRDKKHWEDRYKFHDMPWERGIHHAEVERLFNKYIPRGVSVLDIGCGLGNDAQWLSKMGYQVTGIDISEEAIQQARAKQSPKIAFLALDFLKDSESLPLFDVILDCAVFHLIQDEELRAAFAQNVARHCNNYWINISCSKDEAEKISESSGVKAPPYLTAKKIISAAEPFFEIIEMHRCSFSIKRGIEGNANFHAWGSLLKKR